MQPSKHETAPAEQVCGLTPATYWEFLSGYFVGALKLTFFDASAAREGDCRRVAKCLKATCSSTSVKIHLVVA